VHHAVRTVKFQLQDGDYEVGRWVVERVISPLLSNIVLNEFDQWLEAKYLSKKARKDRWYWNDSIKRQRPVALRENRQWKPAVAYCRINEESDPSSAAWGRGHSSNAGTRGDGGALFMYGCVF